MCELDTQSLNFSTKGLLWCGHIVYQNRPYEKINQRRMILNKSNLVSVLIRLLNQTRDGLILINGNWGVGKTYFLQNELKNFYDEKTIFYMSTLGLNNLQDFKDRILSISYLDSSEEIKKIGELTASASAVVSQEEGVGKFTSQSLSFLTAKIQESVLKDLHAVYIIDDLERISIDLRNDIATYCLQSYQKNNSLDYILVGNFSDESREILNHKEKVISDEVSFLLNNLPDILEVKLKNVNEPEKKLINQVIIGFDVTNLRFINRVMDKLTPLLEVFTTESETKETDIKNLVSSLCAHIILKEKFFYQVDEFHQRYISSSLKSLTIKDEENDKTISKQENELLSITAYKSYDGMMAQYCFNVISHLDILPKLITRNPILKKEEYAGILQPELTEIPESDYCEEITKVILKDNNPTLATWLTATNNYQRLTKNKYISKSKGITNKIIEKNKKSFTDCEIESFFIESFDNINEIPLHILQKEDDELFNFFLNKFIKITQLNTITLLKKKMNDSGWNSVDLEIYQSDFKFKLLETFGLSDVVSGIKKSWGVEDIKLFTNHLSSLYNFSNLADYLSDELPFLNKLLGILRSHSKGIENSFRRGAIIELIKCIERVKELLENSIAQKKPPITNA